MTKPQHLKRGEEMLAWAKELFPIRRSLTGPGVRDTLDFIGALLPGLRRRSAKTGTRAFDWTVPREWLFRSGRLEHEGGGFAIDADENFLHVVGYSTGVDKLIDKTALEPHLHSLVNQPDVIPYVTTYYKENWGFCLKHSDRLVMPEGQYHAYIDADLVDGDLDFADLVLPGKSDREILFSTYVCHPNLANNELSGPVLAIALAQELARRPNRRYTYRFVFVPETIGSLVYLSEEIEHLQAKVDAGFVLSCVGDERAFSHVESPSAATLADRALKAALIGRTNVLTFDFLERGSDERQYCAPGVRLPVCGFCRSKYGEYDEYHTSADDFSVVTAQGLAGAYEVMVSVVDALEANDRYRTNVLGEPQLGKRGLYATTSAKGSAQAFRTRLNVLAFADGSLDLFDLSLRLGSPLADVVAEVALLREHELLASAGREHPFAD